VAILGANRHYQIVICHLLYYVCPLLPLYIVVLPFQDGVYFTTCLYFLTFLCLN